MDCPYATHFWEKDVNMLAHVDVLSGLSEEKKVNKNSPFEGPKSSKRQGHSKPGSAPERCFG